MVALPVTGWDTETGLIEEYNLTPPLVCASFKNADGVGIFKWDHPAAKDIIRHWLRRNITTGANIAYDMGVTAHEYPDLITDIFDAYENDRVRDIQSNQKLIDNAHGELHHPKYRLGKGCYSLAALARRHLGKELDKDTFRLRYGELRDVPLEHWSEGARQYPIDDAVSTYDIDEIQQIGWPELLGSQYREARHAFWLHLISIQGITVDTARVAVLKEQFTRTLNDQIRILYSDDEAKSLLKKNDWSRTMAAAQARLLSFLPNAKRTPKGAVSLAKAECLKSGDRVMIAFAHYTAAKTAAAREVWAEELREHGLIKPPKNEYSRCVALARARMAAVCGGVDRCKPTKKYEELSKEEPLEMSLQYVALDKDACKSSKDPILITFGEYSSTLKLLRTDIPRLERGRIHSRFDPFKASGRTGCGSPYNLQNPPRKGGVRECFIPSRCDDDPKVFIDSDADGLELRSMAQVCITLFGYSKMAEALNKGLDPHIIMAANLLGGITYEECLKRYKGHKLWEKTGGREGVEDHAAAEARQFGKIANFGLAGGMGVLKFVLYSHANEIEITEEQALWIKNVWLDTWPEFRAYFAWAGELLERTDQSEQLFAGRFRGGLGFSDLCNTMFQGLGADAMKAAGWRLAREMYDPSCGSILYGCRIVNFVHDQFIVEAPLRIAHECAMRLKEVMIEEANKWLPDVPLTTTPCLATCWSKEASDIYDENGRLVPWSPKAAANDDAPTVTLTEFEDILEEMAGEGDPEEESEAA